MKVGIFGQDFNRTFGRNRRQIHNLRKCLCLKKVEISQKSNQG